MMTRTKAIEMLEDEIRHIKNMIYPDDLETTVWVSNRIGAIQKGIDAIKNDMVMTPRWQTIRNVGEFWNTVENWVEDNKESGKDLDDLRDYFMEKVDVAKDD